MAGKLSQIREALATCFQENSGPLSKKEVFDWIESHYGDAHFNANTLLAQLYRSCKNVPSAINSSAPKIIKYNKADKTYIALTASELQEYAIASVEVLSEQDSASQAESTFALEAHLRDYLARNLSVLEPGLSLWSEDAIEFGLGNRRVDILAKDTNGVPVVIELKLRQGHEQVIGQALLYRAKLKSLLGIQKARIILIASKISEDLRTASTEVDDVTLFEYVLTMQVNKVTNGLKEKS